MKLRSLALIATLISSTISISNAAFWNHLRGTLSRGIQRFPRYSPALIGATLLKASQKEQDDATVVPLLGSRKCDTISEFMHQPFTIEEDNFGTSPYKKCLRVPYFNCSGHEYDYLISSLASHGAAKVALTNSAEVAEARQRSKLTLGKNITTESILRDVLNEVEKARVKDVYRGQRELWKKAYEVSRKPGATLIFGSRLDYRDPQLMLDESIKYTEWLKHIEREESFLKGYIRGNDVNRQF